MVQAYYDRVTDTYRQKWCDSFHFAIFTGTESLQEAMTATERRIAEEGHFGPEDRVLDIGCGVGGPALNIAEFSGARVTGINIVERHVNIARQQAEARGLSDRTDFQVADAMHMPFADNSFDAAYVFEAGCHMPDKVKFYKECSRVLRPGGVFLGLDWLKKDGLLRDEEAAYIEPVCRLHSVPHLISMNQLREMLTAANLEVDRIEDAAGHGDILRNWELVDTLAIRGVRGLVPWLIPPTLRMLTDGGLALSKAARNGVFLIGHWIAHKPS